MASAFEQTCEQSFCVAAAAAAEAVLVDNRLPAFLLNLLLEKGQEVWTLLP